TLQRAVSDGRHPPHARVRGRGLLAREPRTPLREGADGRVQAEEAGRDGSGDQADPRPRHALRGRVRDGRGAGRRRAGLSVAARSARAARRRGPRRRFANAAPRVTSRPTGGGGRFAQVVVSTSRGGITMKGFATRTALLAVAFATAPVFAADHL